MKKSFNRSTHIFLNGIRTLISPAISILISYLIIHYFSKDLWGEFVHYLLYFYIASMLTNWGQKEYLLRNFSEQPDRLKTNWQEFFTSRLPILLLAIVPPFFIFEAIQAIYLAGWLFATYVSLSIIPIMLFQRDYLRVIFNELLAFGVLIFFVFRAYPYLDLNELLLYYLYYQTIKSIAFILIYRPFFMLKKIRINFALLLISLPFLWLALAGFMQSKIDLYLLQFYTNNRVLGEYQIISGFFIFSQSIASIVLLPYLKNIYRMQSNSLKKLKRMILMGGLLINLLVDGFIYIALYFFFEIHLSPLQIALGFIIGYPAYIYALHVFYLFKTNREKKVLILSIYGFVASGLVSIVFLSLGQGITGALLANAIGQLLVLGLYTQHKIDDQLLETIK